MTEQPAKRDERIAAWLVSSRYYLLILAVAIGGSAYLLKKNVSFDNSIEGMFAKSNVNLQEYQRLKETFGGSEVILCVYEDEKLFNSNGEGLKRLRQRSQELANVRGVTGVLSLSEINQALQEVYSYSEQERKVKSAIGQVGSYLIRKKDDAQNPNNENADNENPNNKEPKVQELDQGESNKDALAGNQSGEQTEGQAPNATQIIPLLNPDDEMAKAFIKTFEGYTHGSDGKTVAIVCLLERLETLEVPRRKIIGSLRRIASGWENSRVTGEPVLLSDGFAFIRRDGNRLNRVCLGLMGIVIIACFRSIRWVFIPVAVFVFAYWLTLAFLALLGWKLTMVSSMLSAIVAVISVATVVHITVRYREARLKKGHSREKSMEIVLAALIMPITWTCLTTAAGFFALTLGDVEPVADFGWMMTFGSLFVLLSVVLLVPGLTLFGNIDSDPQVTWGEGRLEKLLKFSSDQISSHARKIGLWVLIVMSVIGFGCFFLEIETDFTKNFRQDSQIIQAYNFVEERLGGAGMLDVVLQSPEILTDEYLKRVDSLQDELRALQIDTTEGKELALTHVVSFADADRIIRTQNIARILPVEGRFLAMSTVMPGFSDQMKTKVADKDGHHYFRIMLRTSQQKSAAQQEQLIGLVKSTVDQHFPTPVGASESSTMTTGFFVLLSNLVSSVLKDQVKTFVAACVFIGIVILIAFGSIRLVLIALVPNILPVIGLLGMLGWLGIRMNMGAAMIAAVSLGLSIDGTIHYLTSYRHNKQGGHRTSTAIGRVQFRTGRALIYATMALVIGFGSLCVSEFIPTVFFGGLVGLSMLGGMFGNLIVLPVLLTLFDNTPTGSKSKSDLKPEKTREKTAASSHPDSMWNVLESAHELDKKRATIGADEDQFDPEDRNANSQNPEVKLSNSDFENESEVNVTD